jgi:hypothetical protein
MGGGIEGHDGLDGDSRSVAKPVEGAHARRPSAPETAI